MFLSTMHKESLLKSAEFKELPAEGKVTNLIHAANLDEMAKWINDNEWLSKFTVSEINFIGPVRKRRVVFTRTDLQEIETTANYLANGLCNDLIDSQRRDGWNFVFGKEIDNFNCRIKQLKEELFHRIIRLKVTHSKLILSVSGHFENVKGYQTLMVTIEEKENEEVSD